MTLHAPFKISSRLLPALEIGGVTISLDGLAFILDFPDGSEHTVDDIRPPRCGKWDPEEHFSALLGFLGAAAESRQIRERQGRTEINPDGNEGLFVPAIVDWASANSDEIAMVECEIEESATPLIEDDSSAKLVLITPRGWEQV